VSEARLTQAEVANLADRLIEALRRAGFPETLITRWWNEVQYEQLGGRTALQAWQRQEYDDVKRVVEQEASRVFAERLAGTSSIIEKLQQTPPNRPLSGEQFSKLYFTRF
jgi:hypothetical protein